MRQIHHGWWTPGALPESLLPQYQRAVVQSCWRPWTMHARRAQTSVAAPASSPKLQPKKRKPAAEAMA
jgi:hypothetical protein